LRSNVIEAPFFQSVRRKGPVPLAAVLRSIVSPSLKTSPARPVRFHSSVESGALSVRMMSWPSAVMDETFASRFDSA